VHSRTDLLLHHEVEPDRTLTDPDLVRDVRRIFAKTPAMADLNAEILEPLLSQEDQWLFRP
jgi:hypothetical protein